MRTTELIFNANVMKKWFLFVFVLFLCSCYNDAYEPQQVSLNIEESKAKKVFVTEYKVKNIKMLSPDVKNLIDRVWIEKYWQLRKDMDGNEVPDICDTCVYCIVYSLNNDKRYNGDNFIKDWTFFGSDTIDVVSSVRGMPTTWIYTPKKLPDSLTFTIERLYRPFDKSSAMPLEEFTIVLQK